ncbi:hypothetical protein [Chryseobacterium wanjuense]
MGRFFSRFLREGHSNIDDIIARNINNIALVPGYATDEEIEIALQRAILGGTRTRGYLTTLARRIGGYYLQIIRLTFYTILFYFLVLPHCIKQMR